MDIVITLLLFYVHVTSELVFCVDKTVTNQLLRLLITIDFRCSVTIVSVAGDSDFNLETSSLQHCARLTPN